MAKNYENCLTADKVIAKNIRLTFLAHPVYGCPKNFLEFLTTHSVINRMNVCTKFEVCLFLIYWVVGT